MQSALSFPTNVNYGSQRRQSGLKSGGSWIRVRKISNFSGYLTKKFRFFQANYRKISIFQENKKNSNFQAKIGHLQLLLGKLFCLFKSHHFRTYFLYIIGYYNISRPVNDPLRPPCGPHDPPYPKSWGVALATPTPRIYAPDGSCSRV